MLKPGIGWAELGEADQLLIDPSFQPPSRSAVWQVSNQNLKPSLMRVVYLPKTISSNEGHPCSVRRRSTTLDGRDWVSGYPIDGKNPRFGLLHRRSNKGSKPCWWKILFLDKQAYSHKILWEVCGPRSDLALSLLTTLWRKPHSLKKLSMNFAVG